MQKRNQELRGTCVILKQASLNGTTRTFPHVNFQEATKGYPCISIVAFESTAKALEFDFLCRCSALSWNIEICKAFHRNSSMLDKRPELSGSSHLCERWGASQKARRHKIVVDTTHNCCKQSL